MNKTAIKNFAVWARVTLLEEVKQKAFEYQIVQGEKAEASVEVVNGRPLTAQEKQQRRALCRRIEAKGYEQTMEEAAYTWFNRFIALRYMEVNGFLPSKIRVFTNEAGEFKPDILSEAMTVELDGLDREKVFQLLDKQDNEALYKLLLIAQCSALGGSLPRMFEEIADWTELLFPNGLLKSDSILARMVADIPEEDWTDQVQIIGWLYQYYNSELKDDTFAQLKKNIKISKERIPAATQLFTPDWIVRYMVENSLGRLYISEQCAVGSGQSEQERIAQEKAIAEKMGWKYYLPEAEQTPEVRTQLNQLTTDHCSLTTLKLIDPCMGSGHILVYAFDVLMQLYTASGWSERDAVQSILENNLYGLDIDDRAAQLAYFAVMMKARSYDRRIFSRGIQPHVYAIAESNGVSSQTVDYFCNSDSKLKANITKVMEQLRDAKEYGSILNVTGVDFAALYARVEEIREDISMLREPALHTILPLIQVAELLAQKYDVVVTNPPYMGGSGMSAKLSEFVKKNYPDSKSDLFAVFIERCGQMAKRNGYQAMITQHAWMFLSSFEKLRTKLLSVDIVNMAHLGARAFEEIGGEVVQTTSFVIRKSHVASYKGEYCRLIEPTTQQGKEDMFLAGENRYAADQANFSKIPGSPVAYWVSAAILNSFDDDTAANKYADFRHGMSTSDNNRFLRLWFEPNVASIGFEAKSKDDTREQKWYIYLKGGSFRRWYGNYDYVVNWMNDGFEIKEISNIKYPYLKGNLDFVLGGQKYFFTPGYTWSSLTSGHLGMRKFSTGCIFDAKGQCFFPYDKTIGNYMIAFYNSCAFDKYAEILSPTLDFNSGVISKAPLIKSNETLHVNAMVDECVDLAKEDWDSFETSWDFKKHPLV